MRVESTVAYASLAILKVNYDVRGIDYIANFVPFVVEALGQGNQGPVTLTELQVEVATRFGLQLPQGALKTVVKRAAREGYVTADRGMYLRNSSKVATFGLEEKRRKALWQLESLLAKYQQFCADQLNEQIDIDEAVGQLDAYLRAWSVPLLAAVLGDVDWESPPPGEAVQEISAFIEHACAHDPEAFDYLETLVKGTLLANVVYCPGWQSLDRNLNALEVYLDSAVMIRALGFGGDTLAKPYRELLGLLVSAGVKIRAFSHTAKEVRGVLEAAAYVLGIPKSQRFLTGHHEVFEWALSTGKQASDLSLLAEGVEDLLSKLQVKIVDAPEYEIPLGVDEKLLEADLQQSVGYSRREALLHDLDCLVAVFRARRGRFTDRIDRARAVFVTENLRLAKASRRFFEREYGVKRSAIDVCMLDHALTTLMWMRSPLEAPDLPRHRIIADCYAALNPPDEVWGRYIAEVNRLEADDKISENDFYLLRYSIEAKRALMGITKGKLEAFAEGTVLEVLEQSRAAARRDTEEQLKRVAEDLESEREARRADSEARLAEREAYSKRFRTRRARIRRRADAVGLWVSRIFALLAILSLAMGVWLSMPDGFPKVTLPGAVPPALLTLLFLAILLNLWRGATVKRGVKWLDTWIGDAVERAVLWIGGESSEDMPPRATEEGED